MLVFRGQFRSTGHKCEGPQIYSSVVEVLICSWTVPGQLGAELPIFICL